MNYIHYRRFENQQKESENERDTKCERDYC